MGHYWDIIGTVCIHVYVYIYVYNVVTCALGHNYKLMFYNNEETHTIDTVREADGW